MRGGPAFRRPETEKKKKQKREKNTAILVNRAPPPPPQMQVTNPTRSMHEFVNARLRDTDWKEIPHPLVLLIASRHSVESRLGQGWRRVRRRRGARVVSGISKQSVSAVSNHLRSSEAWTAGETRTQMHLRAQQSRGRAWAVSRCETTRQNPRQRAQKLHQDRPGDGRCCSEN
jgi:hypothetical protein